jgi:hypothetical protein
MEMRARVAAALVLTLAGTACKEKTEPLVPANVAANGSASFNSTAGSAVSGSLPSVRVTTTSGTAVPGVDVVFAVTAGGGSVAGANVKTNSDGVATVGGWTLGTVAGANTLTATVSGLTPVTFSATGAAGTAVKLALTTSPSATAVNRAVLAVQPVIQLQDANSNAASETNVVISVSASVGSVVGGSTASTSSSGVATFSGLALAGTAGVRTLTFSAPGMTSVTVEVTTTSGAASAISINGGDGQGYFPSTAVPTAPSVKIGDQDGNGVAGVSVTFTVTGGGGSVTGSPATSNASGIATVGSWALGSAEGPNTMTASATVLSGSPVTFSATSTSNPLQISSVSPATLTSGITATISGTGFNATAANNTVTIDGVATAVTAATSTTLTVTVPTLPCTPSHNGSVSVTTSGLTVQKSHPMQAGTAHNLAAGASVILSSAAAARCNELHNANTNALYYVSIYNTSSTYSTTGAAFELKGTAGAAASIVGDRVVSQRLPSARPPQRRAPRPGERDELAHVNLLERDLEFLKQNAHRWVGRNRAANLTLGGSVAHAVGDAATVRLRNLDASGCSSFLTVTGRVAYVGTKSIIIEDTQNPVLNIDTTYAQIGQEFDAVMMPILETNFGNPLVNDATLDNNGKFIMVFTDKISTMAGGGVAGFVSPCDYFPQSTFASSNVGEYFYAIAPKQPGSISTSGAQSPPVWRWAIRGTIIHEVKHIVSTAERFFRNGGNTFEESWLEESSARLSEELFERARYSFAQRSNIGYGSAGNPVGPYCGVRACGGQARGIVRVFEELDDKWYVAPQDYSTIGRINSSDFSFYATAWSLPRWTIDANATKAESAILKGMTQEPTLTGIANFNNQMGMNFVDALPKWTLAMVLDDYPGLTPADATLKQPSWDLRNVYAGLNADFTPPSVDWPFQPSALSFGAFSRTGSVRAGTAAILQISGAQTLKQSIELKADGSSAAAPAELRMAIVRVQ